MSTFKFRSSIKPALLQLALWRGTLIAGIGVTLLIAIGAFMPSNEMSFWGLPIFLAGIGLITWGWLPYRRLKQLEVQPYQLLLYETELHFKVKKKIIYNVPWDSISQFQYVEDKHNYGIRMTLKSSTSLFIPFFTARTCDELNDTLTYLS